MQKKGNEGKITVKMSEKSQKNHIVSYLPKILISHVSLNEHI